MTLLKRAWALARWFVVLEIGIWRSLFLWATRRVSGRRPGVQVFSYARQVSPLIGAFIFVSAIELPVVHLLLPWDSVRLVADVLSVWALLWMVGLLASVRVFPHLLDGKGLRVRYGTTVDIRVPWDVIAGVTSRRGSVDSGKSVDVEANDSAVVVSVAVMKLTRIEIALHGPTTIELPDGPQEAVTALRCYADDPQSFVAAARKRLSECGEGSSGHDGFDARAAPAPRPRPGGADPRAGRLRRR